MARYALIVGISEYDSKHLQSLRTPATDADAIADLLKKHGGCEQVKVLKGNVTKKALEAAFITLITQQAIKNEVLIYFTGHGLAVKSGLGSTKGYLATTESRLIVESGQLTDEPTKAIAFSDLNALLLSSDLSNLVMLLDSCHSGEFMERDLVERGLSVFNTKQDYFLITACRSHEEAWIKKTEEHSVFTGAVLRALTPENADSDNCITGDRLFDSLRRDLKGSRQEPIRFGKGRALPIVQFSVTELSEYSGLGYQIQSLSKGQTLWNGRYTIRGPLSSGGFSVTYKAVDDDTKRSVVIKTPNQLLVTENEYKKFVRRFKREGEALSKVSHPNIVEVVEYFEEESVPFLVMEFVEGDTLQTYIEEQGRLTQIQAVSIFRKIAEAIAHLHSFGMIHGDINSRNIIIRLDQEPVLIDLGEVDSFQYAPRTEAVSVNMFFSPYEKLRGDIEPHPTMDIYGLSVALYFSVTGEIPQSAFERKMDVLDRKSDGSVLPAPQEYCPDLGAHLIRAILEGMALEPEDRPSSIQSWMSLLPAFNSSKTSSLPRETVVNTASISTNNNFTLDTDTEISQVRQLSVGQLLHGGRYTIKHIFASGGFSIVYLALDHVLENTVVIKTPHPFSLYEEKDRNQIALRLEREYKILLQVSHPNLAQVSNFFIERRTPCLVISYEEGETLNSYIQRKGRLSDANALASFTKLAEGLSALHEAGWIHCDMHPGNIMIRPDGEFVIFDLGSAKRLSPREVTVTTTINDSFSPYEQMRSDNAKTPALDVYGIAATLYFAITTKKPVPAINRKLYGDNLKFPKGPRSRVSRRLRNAVLKGMALEPQNRPQSIQEWMQLL